MAATAFTCRCGQDVTDFLTELDEGALAFSIGEWVVPRGYFVRLTRGLTYRDFVTCRDPRSQYVSADGERQAFDAGDLLVHAEDARLQMADHAVHGCCGWQPRDEPNVLCRDGHDIGTLHTDECWSPLVLRLKGGSVDAVTVR